jgi:hypothetical protein
LLDVLVGTMNSKVSNLRNTPCQLVAISDGTKGFFFTTPTIIKIT